jgi:hypothetical protein
MNDENIVTISWVDESTGDLVELDVPTETAEALRRGERVVGRGWTQRRFTAKEGIARTKEGIARSKARLDQISSRRDEMVDTWPSLKSHGRRGAGGDA